jgi:copper chaperone CopZ
MSGPYNPDMAVAEETIRVTGIRCERCVGRLAAALQGHDGLESARANLVGDVTLVWNEERTSRDEILALLAKAGFREAADSPAYGE